MTDSEDCLDPRPSAPARALAPRPPGTVARQLVFFDNGKLSPPYLRWMPVVEPLVEGLAALGSVRREGSDLLIEPVGEHAARVARWRTEGVDGVVFALCDAGVALPTLLHAAATEAAGIPAVVVCTDQVLDLLAVGAAFQAPGLPLVLLPAGRIDTPEQLVQAAHAIVPEIVQGLTAQAAALLRAFEQRFPAIAGLAAQPGEAPPPPSRYAPYALERRISDGLPVVPPTRSRVTALIDRVRREPGAVVVPSLAPSGAAVTVERAATCAVLAGAEPGDFPFVLAALELMAQPAYWLHLAAITTHPAGNLLVFSGPAADAAGIASGRGCLGPGHRANQAIGRSVSLTLQNVGRAVPGLGTLSLIGSPAQLSCCFADRADGPLPPLYTTLCTGRDTIAWGLKCESPHNVMDHLSSTPESLLQTFCRVAATIGGNNGYMPGDLLLILNPEHADLLARAGWTRTEVGRFIWKHARNHRAELQGRGVKPEWPREWDGLDRLPVVLSPEHVWIVVAGAPGPQSQVAIPWGYGKACWTPVADEGATG